jgi:hypothetical protein
MGGVEIQMPTKLTNLRLIKQHRCYTVTEASRLLGVHKNTIRSWQRAGLDPIDKSRPVMFSGKTLRAFHAGRRKAAKQPCPPGTMYCFSCHTPRLPALGMVDYTPRNSVGGNLRALCVVCDTIMNRRAAFATLAQIMPGIDVQIQERQPRFSQLTQPSLNCDIKSE